MCFPPLTAVPEVPVDLYLVEVGATWISFGWFLSNDPYLSHHVISVLNVKEGEVINITFEGSQPAVNVTDLLPGIEYNFTVVAVAVFDDIEAASLPSRPFSSTTSITGIQYDVTIILNSMSIDAYNIYSPSSSMQ